MAVVATVTDLETADRTPIITGTCDTDNSAIELTINGTDVYNAKSLSGVWQIPTVPYELPVTPIHESSQTPGNDSYVYDSHIVRMSDGRLLSVFYRGPEHTNAGGRLMGCFSTTEGQFWDDEFLVADDPAGTETRTLTVGVASDGTITVFYQVFSYPAAVRTRIDVKYIYSTDNAATWSTSASVQSEFPETQVVPFGEIVETDNGMMASFYGAKGVWVLFSTDNGLTWGGVVTVLSQASVIFAEPSAIAIDDDRIVIVCRHQTNTDWFYYIKSSDGGLTWGSPVGSAYTTTTIAAAAPFASLKLGVNVLVAFGARLDLAKMITCWVNAESFWTDPSISWDESADHRTEMYTSRLATVGTYNLNFGYPFLTEITGIDYTALISFYDFSPNEVEDETDILIATVPRI